MTERRQTVVIGPGGLIELRIADLPAGETAEVIVRVGAAGDRVCEVRELFGSTQALPAAQTITEEELADEIRDFWPARSRRGRIT